MSFWPKLQGDRTLRLEWPRALVVVVALFFILRYLWWRLDTFNADVIVFSYVLYAAEVFGLLTLLLHSLNTWFLSVRESSPPEEGHGVDVFIPTINEPLSVIRRTALCARAMDYPHQTWILDDGRRPEVRALAEQLGCGYIARPDNTHAKAGNLNYALSQTQGDFIAIFDADHAPARGFLMRTLGFFRDARVAFVQTPQDFYNLDSYQHRADVEKGRLWSEQSLFFRVIQRGKDSLNAAFFCGSCAVIRRSALDDIGGFATGTVTEDLHTSLKLHKRGWKSVYFNESLAFGIAAAQVEPFIRQRIRWGQGAMQVWRREGILFTRGLSLPQRLSYFASVFTYFEGWQRAVYYTTPILVLALGWAPIVTDTSTFLTYFIPYLLMTLWASAELGRGYARLALIEQYNMVRFAAFAYATLGLFRGKLPFRVTNKQLDGLTRYSLYLWPQGLIVAINFIALQAGLWNYALGELNRFSYSVNSAWAIFNLLLAVSVLFFSLRRIRFKRLDYRFNVPLVASFHGTNGETVFAAVQDISSTGMRMVVESNPGLGLEREISGHLRLPGQLIPFRALTRTLGTRPQAGMFSIGCEFMWDSRQGLEQLELFLYGSDIEWQVNHISERKPTAMEWLTQRIFPWQELDDLPSRGSPLIHPRPVLYTQDSSGAPTETGLFSYDEEKKQGVACVFMPFPLGMPFEGRVFSPHGWANVRGRVTEDITVANNERKVYFYRVDGELTHAH